MNKRSNGNSHISELWKYFKCRRCGKCCDASGLPWDPFRVQQIADFLKISRRELIEHYYGEFSQDGKSFVLKSKKSKPCPFLHSKRSKKHCLIYALRPKGCRLYPFETDFGRGDVDCPAAKFVFDRFDDLDKTLAEKI